MRVNTTCESFNSEDKMNVKKRDEATYKFYGVYFIYGMSCKRDAASFQRNL